MSVVGLLDAVPKPPRLPAAGCMWPNPFRWVAVNLVGEPYPFGGNPPESGYASDDVNNERLTALNHSFVNDAMKVDDRAPWLERGNLDLIDHRVSDHRAGEGEPHGDREVRYTSFPSIATYVNQCGIGRVGELKSLRHHS